MSSRAALSRKKQRHPPPQNAQSINLHSLASRFSSHPNELVASPTNKPRQSFEALPNLTPSPSIWRHTENNTPDDLLNHIDHQFIETTTTHHTQMDHFHPPPLSRQSQQSYSQAQLSEHQQHVMHYGIDVHTQSLSTMRSRGPPPQPQHQLQQLPQPQPPPLPQPPHRQPRRPPRSLPQEALEVKILPGPINAPLPTSSSFGSSSSLSPFLNRIHESASGNIYSQGPSQSLSQEFIPTRHQPLQSPLSSLPSPSYSQPSPALSSNFSRSPHISYHHPPFHDQPAGPGVRQFPTGSYGNHQATVFQPLSESAPRLRAVSAVAPIHPFPHSNNPVPHQQQYNLRQVASSSSLNSIHNDHLIYQQRRRGSFDSVSILTTSSGLSRDHMPIGPNSSRSMSSASIGRRSEGSIMNSDGKVQFVYPGGRSRAHPNGAPRFRLRGKKKKDKNRHNVDRNGQYGDQANRQGGKGGIADDPKAPRSSEDSWGTPSDPATCSSESSTHFTSPSNTQQSHPPGRSKASGTPKNRGKDVQQPSADISPNVKRESGNNWDEIQRPHTRVLGLASKSKQKKDAESSALPTSLSDGCSFPDGSINLSSIDSNVSSANSRAISGRVLQLNNKIGQYPLDPYDSSLLDIDLHTYTLLRKLHPSEFSPTFHDYGKQPPATVLDLGCGQGHWLLDAAIAWKGFGTLITGFDMVDITKSLRPIAMKLGVAENIKFVRGNFLKQKLPFADGSFDLVRMSFLALAVPFEKWQPLFHEVSRVLAIGGRLELIDDQVVFPYPLVSSPSKTRTTHPAGKDLELYKEAELKDENSDTDTLNEQRQGSLHHPSHQSGGHFLPLVSSMAGGASLSDPYHDHVASSRALESLFEHMLNHKYGLHLHPSEFFVPVLSSVFQHAREMHNIHLVLAPSDPSLRTDDSLDSEKDTLDFLEGCPGVIAWPSATFIGMKENELEILVSKQPKILLSCKSALIEYALNVADEENIDEETILEELWEYEGFVRQRFVPPTAALIDAKTTRSAASDLSIDGQSIRGSVFSMNTLNTISSEGLAAIKDYQADIGEILDFKSLLIGQEHQAALTSKQLQEAATPSPIDPTQATLPTHALTPGAPRPRSSSITTTGTRVPPYSAIEPCHVRNFHIYEATKFS